MMRLTVFGDGNGESILLHLPGDRYGVVDCYANSPSDIKTSQLCLYLEEYNIRKLHFVCWTHPHNDHSRGLLPLLEKYSGHIDYLWIFEGMCFQKLYAYYRSQQQLSDSLIFSKGNEYLISIFFHIQERNRFRGILRVSAKKELYRDDANDLTIEGVAPVDGVVDEYESFLAQVINAEIQEDLFKTQRHNMVSAALMISYGNAKILLAGDTENKTWTILFNEDCYQVGRHPCHIVKVPHHGSSNAYYDDYWNEWTAQNNTTAVITSLSAQKLPEPDINNRIGSLASKLHVLGSASGRRRTGKKFGRKELISRGLAMLGAEYPSTKSRIELSVTKKGEIVEAGLNYRSINSL